MRVETLADGVVLYNADCLEVLPTLGKVDAVVTDPPYGLGETANRIRSRNTLSKRVRQKTKIVVEEFDWDKPVSQELIYTVSEISQWQIIFGGNYYHLPPTSCWLIWDKLNSGDFADCEMAWTNLPKAIRRIQYHWNGCMRKEREVPREHPTQKPIAVMQWCIEHLPPPNETILDPFMGSGTTGVAAIGLGKRFIGIEIEPKYFDIACRRISQAMKGFVAQSFAREQKNKPYGFLTR